MNWILAGIGLVAAVYQLAALFACLRHLLQKRAHSLRASSPGVSILKPVRGFHAGFDEALQSHLHQDYPEFELLAGHRDPNDSAVPALEQAGVSHFVCPQDAPNAKVGVLMDLVQHARFPVVIVNDADIVVPPNYLQEITAALADRQVGLVTCLYRAEGDSWPSRFEALGISTDFVPSALVAPVFGVSEFGFGSTLAFRRADLDAIGGFAAVSGYLADDYQLGARIHRLGRRNVVSYVVVKTRLHAGSWGAVWRHQVRWARTIRMSRTAGYIGLPVTFATLWAIVIACFGLWWWALVVFAYRFAVALVAGGLIIRSPDVLKFFFLIPVRDLYGVAVWAAGLFGDTVEWGGQTLRLDRLGQILSRH